jgi:N4-gp56 family major capsid protein
MANVYTDAGTAYANLVAAGYDKYLEYQLRSTPQFRQFVDKHPVDVTNVGNTVTLSLIQEFAALATTPLTETVDPDAVAPPAPVRVTVTYNEYGNAEITTLKLRNTAFTPPDPAIANVLGKNMVDTLDKLVQNVLDTATNVIGKNAGVIKTQTTAFSEAAVAAGDTFDSTLARNAVSLLRRRNASGRDNAGQYVGVVHPDVSNDLKNDTNWLNPHQYVDTSAIYNSEVGSYMGARYVESPRCTVVTDGAGGTVKVYRTYLLGSQALVEATITEPHIVVGPQVDKLRRFNPMGWYANAGWAIFRQEAIQVVRSSSTIAAL